jgi:MoaA/NifB/PqqE/SkfB family radical SAM enzyme
MDGIFHLMKRRAAFFGKVLQFKLTGRSWPLLVTWALSPRCNYKCIYCYGDYEHREYKPVSLAQGLDLVKTLAAGGTRYIQFSGGEPLMYPHLAELVDCASSHGLCLGMNTNGSLIPENIETVKKIGTICVSLDGREAINDANRGTGTWKRTMKGIETAQEHGVNVHVYCTVTRNNVNGLEELLEWCKERGIWAEFGFLVNRSLKSDRDYSAIDLDVQTFRRAQRSLIGFKRRNYPILFSRQVMERVAAWPDFSRKMWRGGNPPFSFIECYQGKLMVFVDCDGKVYPCIQMIGDFDAVDFRTGGFQKAYERCQSHDCRACYLMCVNDFNLLFSLNPGVILNNTLITLKESLWRRKKRVPGITTG